MAKPFIFISRFRHHPTKWQSLPVRKIIKFKLRSQRYSQHWELRGRRITTSDNSRRDKNNESLSGARSKSHFLVEPATLEQHVGCNYFNLTWAQLFLGESLEPTRWHLMFPLNQFHDLRLVECELQIVKSSTQLSILNFLILQRVSDNTMWNLETSQLHPIGMKAVQSALETLSS